jgi:hypothetical protein
VLSPEDIANRVLAGIDVPLDPTQDLGGFVAYWESIKSEDELLGQFSVEQTMALERKAREAAALMQAMEQMQAQQANVSQMQANAANGAQQAGMVTPSPAQAGGAEAAMQQ